VPPSNSRFIVGIDLGTTNCAIAVCDATALADVGGPPPPIRVLDVPQLVMPGEIAARPLLPSFLYLPGAQDFPAGSLALPWAPDPPYAGGELARRRGAENPGRLVSSAKSWLSYGGAQRTGPILPWGAPDGVERISPVDASAEYLRHLAATFDAFARGSEEQGLAAQDVLLTVPASFDEEARELTLRAARAAGLDRVTLLEEPQAAFYAWIAAQGERWRRRIRVGDLILVVDLGGGTTDFSLIAVTEHEGALALERVAVGDHILLGGDNMDLALARVLQSRLEAGGHRLDTMQLHGMWHQCRLAKEALLTDPAVRERPVTVLGRGSRLIGGTITTTLTIDDVNAVLLDGFVPVVRGDEMPARQRRTGLQELGLPYAADPAVTRHLARFLGRQAVADSAVDIRRGPSGFACPTHVLFNGGVMKAHAVQQRLVSVIDGWLAEQGFGPVTVLEGEDLDHAVARGAVYYGAARRGRGIRIRSGAPRTYYVGIESAMPAVPGMPAPLKALCVVPFGMEEGTTTSIPNREFGLVVGEPAEFRFLSSTVRKGDAPGAMIEDWGDDIEELGPLEVTLQIDGQEDALVPVTLESHVNELGTLELWCVARDRSQRWKLELNIRENQDEPA
jgi:molecular chaperone DnaK (HSP70)